MLFITTPTAFLAPHCGVINIYFHSYFINFEQSPQNLKAGPVSDLLSVFNMSRKASKRVSFSPEMNEKPILYLKQNGGGGRRRVAGDWTLQRLLKDEEPLSAPIKLLRGLRAKLARAVCVISARKRTSRKVSSASSNLTRSRSCSDSMESHRAEALEDCIEFLNSASSLQRTNSVASNAC